MNNLTTSKHTRANYDLSVIIIFYNMCREAKRTLYSLTKEYQQGIDDISYEVIAIDNCSTKPLNNSFVEEFGEDFRYEYFDTNVSSPCQALNYGARIARGNLITLCIDGARIFSPGILHYSILASRIYKKPFIYTLGMHIGHKPQNFLAEENYSQSDEDSLMASIDWIKDGYSLFEISAAALSSGNGYFSNLSESNCVTMLHSTYQEMGGFNEEFTSVGGGIANLDFFNRANMIEDINPILLLGEATFHQFHGGTATNVPLKHHPWEKMLEEYQSIYGKPYKSIFISPTYFGNIHPRCYRLLEPPMETPKR
jgi:glycosyltransferase involved in cell wall biosynthesis